MELYQILNGAAVRWQGEAVNGVRHPPNVAQLWTDAELAAAGLYRPAPADPVPAGEEVVSSSVKVVGGVPKRVDVTQPIPAPVAADFILEPYQFHAALEVNGLTANVTAAIDAIADPIAKAVAKSRMANSAQYHRDDPLVLTLAAALSLTDAALDAMWIAAKDY